MTLFGHTSDGQPVHRLTIAGGDLTAAFLTRGAVLHSLRMAGVDHDLTLGSPTVADYETATPYHGAIVGPVANRITGARATIAGTEHRFPANQDGRITLHSGDIGTHTKLWEVTDHGPSHIVLAVTLPDSEGGFPGTRLITAHYEIEAPATLRLTLDVTTDRLTPVNVVNHSYWTMGGATFAGHTLRIAADRYTPITADVTPTGEIAPVAGTPFDFRAGRPLTPADPPLDTNFCLADARGALRDVLHLAAPGGPSMTIATTEPGLQIYDGRTLSPPYAALAIEPQFWPDALANPAFPSILLAPGDPWQQVTEWRFSH